MRWLSLMLMAFALLTQTAAADELPAPISCYQESANSNDLASYAACFIADAEIIDASRMSLQYAQ